MNTPDDFERQLLHRAQKKLPVEWRAEILSAAYSERANTVASEPSHTPAWTLKKVNYAAFAAVWILIGAFYALNHLSSPVPYVAKRTVSPPLLDEQWQKQQRLLAELMGEPAPQPQPPPQPASGTHPRRSGMRAGSSKSSKTV